MFSKFVKFHLVQGGNHQEITRKNNVVQGGGRNTIGRREKWPKQSWEEGEIGGKSREEVEKEKLGVGRIELDGLG